MTTVHPAARPAVFVSQSDLDRLLLLLPEMITPATPGARLLAEELARAQVCAEPEMPARLVRLGSRVRYRDDINGRQRVVTVVLPPDADADEGKVSVLTPIGAALLGLPEEQSFAWLDPAGALRGITVLGLED